MVYLMLILAVVAEVVATSALKASAGFTKPLPSFLVVVGYALAFYLLGRVLTVVPVGVAYAIWAGLGIVLVSLVGMLMFKERPDAPAVIGIGLIVAGVVVLQVFSRSTFH